MPEEDNIIEFPKATVSPLAMPTEDLQQVTYHYAGFRANKNGQSTWFDGIMSLDRLITEQTDYDSLKKIIAEHYDMPESNLVITSLAVLATAS